MDKDNLVNLIKEITLQTIEKQQNKLLEIPIAVSNRHIHLSQEHLERIFGSGYKLDKQKNLSQPNQYAAKETVTLIGPKGRINNVRILGPSRLVTQVEVSLFDGYTLGLVPPVRASGDIEGSPPITIQGPRGQVHLEEGLICAERHIHMHIDDAEKFGVKDGQYVQIKVPGQRGLIFDQVLIRVSSKYLLEMHIDLDEANAAQIKNGQLGILQI